MTTWTSFTLAGVTKGIPPEVVTAYQNWVLANPEKAPRLGEIVDEVRATFRSAVKANPKNVVDPAEETVPFTGYHHAVSMVSYLLSMETGLAGAGSVSGVFPVIKEVGTSVIVSTAGGGFNLMADLSQRMVRADIWLRMVESGTITIGDDVGGGGGTPSYVSDRIDRIDGTLGREMR